MCLFLSLWFDTAIRGCQLEEAGEELGEEQHPQQSVELAEQLGDLYCKVGCYRKALEAYRAQVTESHTFSLTDIFIHSC